MKKILFICLAAMALTACGGGSKEDKAEAMARGEMSK